MRMNPAPQHQCPVDCPFRGDLAKDADRMATARDWLIRKLTELHEAGRSQEQIGKELGFSQSSVSRMMRTAGISARRKPFERLAARVAPKAAPQTEYFVMA